MFPYRTVGTVFATLAVGAACAMPSAASSMQGIGGENVQLDLVQHAYADSMSLDPAALQDGEYTVGASLTKLAAVDEQTMPSVFLSDTARLYVTGGDAWLEVGLRTANIMGNDYNADGLKFYTSDSYTLSGSTMTISSVGSAYSTVLSYVPDPADRYKHYPRRVLGELPEQAVTNGGYLAVAMGSSVMSSSGLCLKIDWASLAQTSDSTPTIPEPEAADKAVLAEKIAQAEELAASTQDVQRFTDVRVELEQARSAYDDGKALQDRVDASAQALNLTMQQFMKASLSSLCEQASSVEAGKYTAYSRAEFSKQYRNAQQLLLDIEARQSEIDGAYMALKSAMDGLVLAEVDKTDLYDLVVEADGVRQGAATDSAFGAVRTAAESARAVCDDDDATRQDANDAKAKLISALNMCAKSDLTQQLGMARQVATEAYTEESAAALSAAVVRAEGVSRKASSTRSDCWAAADALRDAMANLVEGPALVEPQEGNARTATVRYLNENGSASMAGAYMLPTACVTALADGGYAVDVTPNEQGLAYGVSIYRNADDPAERIVKDDVVSYRLVVSTLANPIPVYFDVPAMGARPAARLEVESEDYAYRAEEGDEDAKVGEAEEVKPARDRSDAQTAGSDKAAKAVVIAKKKVTSAVVRSALRRANNPNAVQVTLGPNVKSIAKGAFKGTNVKTLVVKTSKLTKRSARGCLKGSKVRTICVDLGKKKANKKLVKRYRKVFTKKICGAKPRIR